MAKVNPFEAVIKKYQTIKEQPTYDIQPLALNDIWNQFHLGSMYSIWGEAGCGKSTIAIQVVRSLLKQGLKGVFIDVEKALNAQQLDAFRIREFAETGQLIIITVGNMKEYEEIIVTLPDSDIDFMVTDSITMVRPYTPNELMVSDIRPGIKSLQEANVLNKLKEICYHNNIGIILLAHARANIQISGPINKYAPAKKQAGGFALLHNPDIITEISINSKVKDEEGNIIGNDVTMRCTKNKWTAPFIPKRETLFFGKGIDAKFSIIKKAIEMGVILHQSGARSWFLPFEPDVKYSKKTIWQLTGAQCKLLKEEVLRVEQTEE